MYRFFSASLIGIFLTVSNLQSQVQEFKFGQVSSEELEMSVYPLDSSADAVYLVRHGDVNFNESDLMMYLTMHVRIKILKESAFDRADVELRYTKGTNPIQKLKAATYNLENGKVVTTNISKKQWVDERFNDKRWTKKVSFPDVKVGSVIEYTYSQQVSNFTRLPSWNFQVSIPTVYTEFRLQIPRYGEYQPKFQSYIPLDYNNNTAQYYHMIMKDVPALKQEPYVATMENFRSKIEFEIKSYNIPGRGSETFMQTWDAITTELHSNDGLGQALEKSVGLRRVYPEDKGWGNDEKSMIEIYNYVRDHFKWTEYNAFVIEDNFRELWEKGEGDAADINMTLAAFLKKAGIITYPITLSTRRHGYINQYVPLVNQFNYLVVMATIGDKQYLLDATDKYRPYNVLPERALNGNGLIVSGLGTRWIDMNLNKELNSKTISGEFSFNDDDLLAGKMAINFRGTAASRLRDSMLEEMEKSESDDEDAEDDEDDPVEETEDLDDYKTGEISNLEVQNLESPQENLKVNYDFTTEEGINFIGDKIFMSPILIKHVDENPFKLEKRLYPVELAAPIADTYIFKIHIPEGYEVEELPKSENILLPEKGGRYMYTIGQQGNDVTVMVRLNLSKTTYTSEEYEYLRELFTLIINKQDEQIVLKESGQ